MTRAKLFYDKQKQQNGIIKNHDYTAFDEIQTIVFQEPAEIQAALKSYLESGKTTIDNTGVLFRVWTDVNGEYSSEQTT